MKGTQAVRTRRRLLHGAAVATLACAALAASPVVANASTSPFAQSWETPESYRASIDFVPYSNGELWVGGMGCNSPAVSIWVDLMRTSDHAVILTTRFDHEVVADGSWHWLDDHLVVSGTAYYERFRAQNRQTNLYEAIACQGVEAEW
jgi:hypothetical protein